MLRLLETLDPSRRAALVGSLLTGLLLVVVTVALVGSGDRGLAGTAVVLLVSVALVISLQTFIGNSGILSFGHVAFMGVGAYATALLTIPLAIRESQLPELPALLAGVELGLPWVIVIAGGLCAGLGLIVGAVFVRMNVNAFVMSTLALLIVVYTVMVNWATVTRGGQGVFGVPRLIDPWIALVAAVVFIGVARLFKASGVGLRVRASREDELAARAAGIDVPRVRLLTFVLSAAMMGAAGSLWSLNVIAFDPDQFSFGMTFALLAMLVVGGRESVFGAVLGAMVVVVITEVLSRIEQGVVIGSFELPRITGTVQFALAALIIISLIRRPEGLVGRREAEDFVPRIRAWLARGYAGGADAAASADVSATPVQAPTPAAQASETAPAESAAPLLVGAGISKAFGGVQALDAVDIEIRPGEILGVIGPNGSGKSTLLNVLSGITLPDAGRVSLGGRDITGQPSHETARRGITRTFQNIRLFPHLTLRENVAAPHGSSRGRVERLLASLDLAGLGQSEADTLSYGMQRRLEISRALSTRPSVVLLDEPAAGMNESESDVLLENIRAIARDDGCAIIIVDHDLRLITRLCDRIQVLETGRTLALGTPDDVVANPAVVAAYLGSG
ncbi:MAG: branched-chain amino acid ABC transporter ATP-binding protein/permease [Chloroflexi bacterium]|nr:branched-chain amino acid ABC transporter ATP-binding protein/permease [Chloroflexota bacterium]